MIAKSEAIVLKSIKYGDSSKIVTLFTKDYGKISVIAKGARKPKNKFGSTLNPMSYINVNFYFKQNRDINTLSNCDIIENFSNIDTNFRNLISALVLAEVINYVTDKNEINDQLFNLLLNTIRQINLNNEYAFNFTLKAFIELAQILGFALKFKNIEDNLDTIMFSLEDGESINTMPTNNNYYNLSVNAINTLYNLQCANNIREIKSFEIDKVNFIESINFFQRYLNFHLDKIFKLKTLNLLQQL